MTINRTTQPEGERVEPCPFCGTSDLLDIEQREHETGVVCRRCGGQLWSKLGRDRAIGNWNTRKTSRGGKA